MITGMWSCTQQYRRTEYLLHSTWGSMGYLYDLHQSFHSPCVEQERSHTVSPHRLSKKVTTSAHNFNCASAVVIVSYFLHRSTHRLQRTIRWSHTGRLWYFVPFPEERNICTEHLISGNAEQLRYCRSSTLKPTTTAHNNVVVTQNGCHSSYLLHRWHTVHSTRPTKTTTAISRTQSTNSQVKNERIILQPGAHYSTVSFR